MIASNSFTWLDAISIVVVISLCVVSIMMFAKDSGGEK